jgi:hypothetical protein
MTESNQITEADLINEYKSYYEQSKKHINLINESALDQLDLNLKPYIQNTERKTKNIEILYGLISNFIKNYTADDSKSSMYLAHHGINMTKIDRDLQELKSQIKTSYNVLQVEQAVDLSERYFHNYQTERRQVDFQNFYYASIRDELNMDIDNIKLAHGFKDILSFENEISQFKSITPLKERYESFQSVNTLTNIKPMISIEDSETFEKYFRYMKLYFYYKTFNKQVPENPDMIFNQSELSSTNHLIPVKTVLYYLKDQFDDFRKNLFTLLFTQIDIKTKLTSRTLLSNTIKFYESEFFKRISRDSHSVYNDKEKIEIISQYVNHVNWYKLNISRSVNQDKLKNWGIVYYLIRSGFEDLALTYARKINESDMTIFCEVYSQIILNKDINRDLYYQLVNVIKSRDEDLAKVNPYKFNCFMLATRLPTAIDLTLLDTQEEYLWFYLKFVNITDNFNELGYNEFLTLRELQEYILSDMKKNSLESTLVCFSLQLYEEGLKLLPKNNHLIDTVNLMTLLNELKLYRNITHIDDIPLENNSDNMDTFYKTSVDQFISTYMTNKPKETVNYIRFMTENYIEKMSQLKNLTILINPKESLYTIKDQTVSLSNLFSDSEIKEIVSRIVGSSSLYDVDTVVLLAKNNQMYKELVKIMLKDCINNLLHKIPTKLLRNKTHPLKTDGWYSTSITEKYGDIIKEIRVVTNNLDEVTRYNFKILLQLKTIEDMYNLIALDKDNEALQVSIDLYSFSLIIRLTLSHMKMNH